MYIDGKVNEGLKKINETVQAVTSEIMREIRRTEERDTVMRERLRMALIRVEEFMGELPHNQVDEDLLEEIRQILYS